MTQRWIPWVATCIIAALFPPAPGEARAQDPLPQERLSQAKSLYVSAAYEEALSVLNTLEPADALAREAALYRAFCLIALGRDANGAIEAVVTADPMFVPSTADLSPRVRDLFLETRRKLLPGLARQVYSEGRKAFQAKGYDQALQKFERVVRLSNDPDMQEIAEMADLRLLATGFIDLSRAATEEERAPEPPPATSVTNAAPRTESPPEPQITSPVPIQQEIPEWEASSADAAFPAFSGAVRVLIGADGTVRSATIVESVHPLYDPRLLAAAQNWLYKPATLRGVPIEIEKVVKVDLRVR